MEPSKESLELAGRRICGTQFRQKPATELALAIDALVERKVAQAVKDKEVAYTHSKVFHDRLVAAQEAFIEKDARIKELEEALDAHAERVAAERCAQKDARIKELKEALDKIAGSCGNIVIDIARAALEGRK